MMQSPLFVLLLFAGAVYLGKLWYGDFRAWKSGNPAPHPLPGATGVAPAALWIAVFGSLLLVGLETGGEMALGVSAEQSDIPAIFLLSMLGAGIIEELVFRGYVVISGRGRGLLVTGILGASLVFALAHYQYYLEVPEDGGWRELTLILTPKSFWTLFLLFLNSLWFYTVRFFRWNPYQSLLPCFAAHVASNAAVFLVKLAQGKVTGLY